MNLAMVAHPATLPVRGAEMQGAEVSTRTTTLKSADSEMQARTTTRTLEVADSGATAGPTTTNSPKRTNPTTNAEQDSPNMSTRPVMTNASKIPTRQG